MARIRPGTGASRKYLPWAFVLPTVAILLGLTIYPLLYSLGLSFTTWQLGLNPSPVFNRVDNYIRAFTDPRFWSSFGRTVKLLVVCLVTELVLGVAVALFLTNEFAGKRLLRTVATVPMMLAPVVVGYMWKMMFHGFAGPMGHLPTLLGCASPQWLSSSRVALWSVMLVDIWQWTPFVAILLLAGMQSLPVEPYEAAVIDGITGFQSLRYLTLPLLEPVLSAVVLFRVIDLFKVFDTIYIMTSGGPGSSTETSSFYVYTLGFKTFDVGYSAAVSYILLIAVTVLTNTLARRLSRQG